MEISARTAVTMATRVYQLNEAATPETIVALINRDVGGGLQLPSSTLKGQYGVGALKVRSHGGLFIIGKDKYKGDAFLIFRGTQLLIDWFSNANIATCSTSSGQVHAGFYKAMSSMKGQIREFVQEALKSGVVRFHCIGHSLGGAIATLCADWLKTIFKFTPYVYTFGAPRPGLITFANHVSSAIPENHLYRVYHSGDVVPLVAPWPFVHAPNSSRAARIEYGGFTPNTASHKIERYVTSVSDSEGSKPWDVLVVSNERALSGKALEDWILGPADSTATGLTTSFIEKISAGVRHLMLNVLKGVLGGLTRGISSAFTWYDFVAIVFKKGLALT
ncbi:MAG: lipase family protein, partial [Cellvibrio sp.]